MKKAFESLHMGNTEAAEDLFRKSISITREMVFNLTHHLDMEHIPFYISPFEADPQMAYLTLSGYADICITEDSDLIIYGTPIVLSKLDTNGFGISICWDDIHRGLNLTLDQIQLASIISGCDYTSGIPGIGLKTSISLFKQYHTLDNVLAHIFRVKNSSNHTNISDSTSFSTNESSHGLNSKDKYSDGQLPESPVISPQLFHSRSTYTVQIIDALFVFRHGIIYEPKAMKFLPLIPLNIENIQQCDPETLSILTPQIKKISESQSNSKLSKDDPISSDPSVELSQRQKLNFDIPITTQRLNNIGLPYLFTLHSMNLSYSKGSIFYDLARGIIHPKSFSIFDDSQLVDYKLFVELLSSQSTASGSDSQDSLSIDVPIDFWQYCPENDPILGSGLSGSKIQFHHTLLEFPQNSGSITDPEIPKISTEEGFPRGAFSFDPSSLSFFELSPLNPNSPSPSYSSSINPSHNHPFIPNQPNKPVEPENIHDPESNGVNIPSIYFNSILRGKRDRLGNSISPSTPQPQSDALSPYQDVNQTLLDGEVIPESPLVQNPRILLSIPESPDASLYRTMTANM